MAHDNVLVVVVADDSDEHHIINRSISNIFRNVVIISCYTIDTAFRQLDAMSLLPHLIIVHFNLPGEGIALLSELNTRQRCKHIPALIYSGMISDDDLKTAIIHGADSFGV